MCLAPGEDAQALLRTRYNGDVVQVCIRVAPRVAYFALHTAPVLVLPLPAVLRVLESSVAQQLLDLGRVSSAAYLRCGQNVVGHSNNALLHRPFILAANQLRDIRDKLKSDIILQFWLREAIPLSFLISKIFTLAFYVYYCNAETFLVRPCKLIPITVTFKRLNLETPQLFFYYFFLKLDIKIIFRKALLI